MGSDSERFFEDSHANRIKYRTLFISDLHLGTKGCQAERFLDFFNKHAFENIYIVGDFIDIWMLKKTVHWPQSHTDIIRKILKRSKHSKIYLLIGNHDEFGKHFLGHFANIEICERLTHITADNKRILILHGHQFDYIIINAKWIAYLGSLAYNLIISMNLFVDKIRRMFGFHRHWSLSSYIKKRVKNAASFIFSFEDTVSKYAKKGGFDGVLAGHIHTPCIKNINGIEYYNSGDWVESCSALVEDCNGKIHMINGWQNEHLNK